MPSVETLKNAVLILLVPVIIVLSFYLFGGVINYGATHRGSLLRRLLIPAGVAVLVIVLVVVIWVWAINDVFFPH